MSRAGTGGRLTERDKQFCRLIASGVSNTSAYMQAFGCTRSSASSGAVRKLKSASVQAYLGKIGKRRQEVQELAAVWTKAQRQQKVQQWAIEAHDAGDLQTALRCVQELNRMDGAYEPEKVDVRGVLGVSAVVAALHEEGSRPRVAE